MEALAQDGEQSVNYLDKYSESVQELMNLTRNKRRFYQQGIQATTLILSSRPLCHPPSPHRTHKNESKRDILVVKTGFAHLHLPQSSPSSANW
jgi:hypothetical protein